MRVTIHAQFDIPEDDYEGPNPQHHLMLDLRDQISNEMGLKVYNQLHRDPAVVCTAPEDDDLFRDPDGNIIGHLKVFKETAT